MPTPPSPRTGSPHTGKVRRQPQRTCIACRDSGDKRALTRLVRAQDGHVRLDRTGRANGRGAYLCDQPQCWERALGRADALGRALKVALSAEDRAAILEEAPLLEPGEPRDAAREHNETDAHERAGEDG